jgi:hypothetical protein
MAFPFGDRHDSGDRCLNAYMPVFAAVQYIWSTPKILTLKTMKDPNAVAKIQRTR